MKISNLRPLGLYIHIPYCLQRCFYCDFSTVLRDHKTPPSRYLELLILEMQQRREWFLNHELKTIYFGGGTPSLIDGQFIISLLNELSNLGVNLKSVTEMTLEIDPGTANVQKIADFQKAGVTRFSVGVQTFNDDHLKRLGRKHSVNETRQLLSILNEMNLSFTADLLFSLPQQQPADLKSDIENLIQFSPGHISAYYLTLPGHHRLQTGRPDDDADSEMFDTLDQNLISYGYERYEISNYARPGFSSQHNLIYWNDQAYLGLGMSSHSYAPHRGEFGLRFWNHPRMEDYEQQVQLARPWAQSEELQLWESLTDYCHISLRRRSGLDITAFTNKYGSARVPLLWERFDRAWQRSLVEKTPTGFRLNSDGCRLANVVLQEFTFLAEDVGGG